MKKKLLRNFPAWKNGEQLWRIMKLTMLLSFCFVVYVSGHTYSQTTRLSLKLKNSTIKEVLDLVEEKTEFFFLYKIEELDEKQRVDIEVENATVPEILDQILKGQDVVYDIYDRQIIIRKGLNNNQSTEEQNGVKPGVQNQTKKITGRVTDGQKQPLPGVAVVVKGTTKGTVTDSDGNYLLSNIAEDATLVFSFVGMRTQEVPVGDQTKIDVTMTEDVIGIEEVVAVGYGTMKKSDITGSISSVPMDFVRNQPVRSLADILQGRAAGVYLNKTSGQIGSNTKIRIRGPNSISGNNEPLTVVDGIIGADMGSVHDIESIEILKDASATAIYGERASNGVILVTTKKATSKVPKLKVSFNTAFSTLDTDYPDMMNTAEYAEFINNFQGAGTFSEAEIENFRQNGGTDWPASLVQTGIKNDHYISYSQKADKLSIYLSGRYSDEKGTMINTGTGGNYYLRSNVTFDPNERLSFNFDLKANKTKSENGTLSMSDKKYHPVLQALIWSPTEPIWLNEEEGQYNLTDRFGALLDNPYMLAKEQQRLYMGHAISAQFDGRYNVTKGLTYSVTGFASKNATQDAEYQNAWVRVRGEKSSRGSRDIFNWRIINKLQYDKVINNAHNFNLSGIYEAEASEIWEVSGEGENMPLPDLASYYQIGMSNVQTASSGYEQLSRLAYLGRLNYHFKSRYYLTASYRVDGKSGPTNRRDEIKFGAFPSFALSWRASEEPFLVNNGFFDNLKLRFGWGITGNPAESQYATMIERSFDFGIEGDILGYSPGIPVNPKVRWEQTAQTDIGLDMSIFNGRLSFSVDFFKKETTDLLTQIELPSYLGHQWKDDPGSYLQNLGEIHNKGFEATLDITPVQTRSFYWDVNINFSLVRNKVIDLGEQAAFLTGTTGAGLISHNSYRVQEGSPLGTMWGYKWLGIWSSAEEAEAERYGQVPGDNKYEDLNNDEKISLEDDGQIIGNANPDFLWGLSNAIHYKNFDLSFLIQGMHGQDIFNIGRAAAASIHTDSRTVTLKEPATNYWTPENQDTEWPNIYSSSNKTYLNSSRWIEDGSWVKIKYVGLTYNIPKKIAKIGNIALSVSAEELLTFTKYKGFDPEVSASEGSDLWGGFDMGTYPIPSTYTFGISLEF